VKKRYLALLWLVGGILNLAPLALAAPSARAATEWARMRLAQGQDVPYESWEYGVNLLLYLRVYFTCILSSSLLLAISSVVVVFGSMKLVCEPIRVGRLALTGLLIGALPSTLWSLLILLSFVRGWFL
jgi:hypothetical protein